MTGTSIAVLDDYQRVAAGCADWSTLDADVRFFEAPIAPDDIGRVLAGFDVIVAMRERTGFPAAAFSELPDLRLLVTTGMRNDAIDLAAAARAGVVVCGTPSPGHATAELTFALILALGRGLVGEVESMRRGGWQVGLGEDVRGATLGLIGLGRLGSQVAGFARAFSMNVVAWSENLTAERAEATGVQRVSFDALLTGSDFVSIHLRLSDRTEGLIGAREFEAMKPSAYLVNTSRGPIVDSTALLAAVKQGHIAGAAIDVYDTEPLASDHPLRSEPRIITTPHIGYVTRPTYRIFYEAAVEDIVAWQAGAPVRVLAEPAG